MGSQKIEEANGLLTEGFSKINASLVVLEENGFTGEMLKRLRQPGGDILAKQIVALFTGAHYQIKANWYNFYKKYFGIDVDLSQLKIPVAKLAFTRPIIIIPGITLNLVVKKMKEHFNVSSYTNDLDKVVIKNHREAKHEPYAIWVKDGLEPEKDYRDVSAGGLAKKFIFGQTLLERLIHEFEYWGKTKKNLDYKNITLCSGSRCSIDGVPSVCFNPDRDEVRVSWGTADDSSGRLGAREVSF